MTKKRKSAERQANRESQLARDLGDQGHEPEAWFETTIVGYTELAWKMRFSSGREEWVPFRIGTIFPVDKRGSRVVLGLPRWVVDNKRLWSDMAKGEVGILTEDHLRILNGPTEANQEREAPAPDGEPEVLDMQGKDRGSDPR